MSAELGDEPDITFTPEAAASFAASIENLISTLKEFSHVVLGFSDLEESAQRDAFDQAEKMLGDALYRANAAEGEWCDEYSFWPADPDDEDDDDEEEDEGEDAEDDEPGSGSDKAVMVMRVDLHVTNQELLLQSAHEFDDCSGGHAKDTLSAIQALLPRSVGVLEESFSEFADVNWAFAGVSVEPGPSPDVMEEDAETLFGVLDDPNFRSFYMTYEG